MGQFGLGHTTYAGIGEETSYGVPVARTAFFDIESESLVAEHRRIEAASLNQIGIRKERIASGSKRFAGNITMHATYTDQGLIWKHALGAVSTTANFTNAALNNHVFQIADALPTGLTLEIFRDTSAFYSPDGEVNKSFVYRGSKITSLTLSAEIDAFLMMDIGFVAYQEVREAKTAAATVLGDLDNTRNPVVFTEGMLSYGNFNFNINDTTPEGVDAVVTASVNIESFEVTIDNNLEVDRGSIGSALIRQPVRADGKLSITGSFVADFNSFREYTDFLASTTKKLALTFTRGDITAGTTWQRLQLIFHDIVPTGNPINVTGEGPIKQTVEFKAYRSIVAAGATNAAPFGGGTNSTGEIIVVLTNASATPG